MNLNQSNWLRTSFIHSSSYWNRVEKDNSKLKYKVKKEEEERYIESIFSCKNRKINEKLNKEQETTTLSLLEKIIIVILIPFNDFPTMKGLLIGL
ncbi:MAG TPA: hypothetical protein VFY68_11150 [Nitrososphaeraceae archaeon]|nr:hypothetical protein [Nitrososphaeraceae archaeon]